MSCADLSTLPNRLMVVFLESYSEGLQVDADHALHFAMRDLCSHMAAEIIAEDQMRKGMTLSDVILFLSQAAEGKR